VPGGPFQTPVLSAKAETGAPAVAK
jgi:hypothetical protein